MRIQRQAETFAWRLADLTAPAPISSPPGGDWGKMPDIKMGPSTPPGWSPGSTPTSPWHSTPSSSSGGSSSSTNGYKPITVDGSGLDAAHSYAQQMNGRAYQYGGVGSKGGVDCSGAASTMYAYATGQDPNVRHFSTTSNFPSLGFQPGYQEGAFNIGVNPKPGMSGHMATTLPDGTHVESGGAANKFQYGGTAAGALDPQFSQQWHLPITSTTSAPPGTGSS